jgi:formylglycine-generating enzyme required for sulfatase activity
MADIFISYKREDRERVEPLVRLLETQGYTVWWDPTIIPGEEFASVIREALDEAACVIACWSRLSIESFWVRDEAGIGRDRGMLVPVSLDGTEPPLGFRQFQTANLSDWIGDPADPRIMLVVAGVHRLVGEPVRPEVIPPPLPAIEYDIAREHVMARMKAEQAHWDTIRKSRRKADFESFLVAYSDGHFAGPAQARLEQLEQREAGRSTSFIARIPRIELLGAGTLALVLVGLVLLWAQGVDIESEARMKAEAEAQAKAKIAADVKRQAEAIAADKVQHYEAQRKAEDAKRLADAEGVKKARLEQERMVAEFKRTTAIQETGGDQKADQTTMAPGRTFRDCDVCPEMVVLPAGEFMMGSDDYDEEGPRHKVTIRQPFAVGKFEVTFAEWEACLAGGGCARDWNPSDSGWGKGRRPVISSWHDANDYAAWMSRKTGKPYRLLSEAEWEYAARAGTTTKYAFGDTITASQAQYSANSTAAVGSFKANAFGIHDMHGNVWEWVEDNWHGDYQGAPQDGSAWHGSNTTRRVLRGGSWDLNFPVNLRSSSRISYPPHGANANFGFRIARTLDR